MELQLLGVDVESIGSARALRVAMAAVEKLKRDPNSLWRAELLGNPDLVGWGAQEFLSAGLVNITRAIAKGGKLSESERVSVPVPQKKKTSHAVRVGPGGIDFSGIRAVLGGVNG